MAALPEIKFTSKGPRVTRIGLGGEGVLRTYGRDAEAGEVIREALKQGITYFDTAPAYSGSQAYLGSIWSEEPETRARVFHTSKSAQRNFDGAMQDLEQTLRILHSSTLDLWQIHDVRTLADVRRIEAPDGALNAFVQAREQGRVKHIGVSGHHDPGVLKICVQNWPLDSVLLPANPAEVHLGGFLDDVAGRAREKDMAVIGMKCLGGGHYVKPQRGATAEKLLNYALHSGVDLIIVGCSSPEEVRALVGAAQGEPLDERERSELEGLFLPGVRQFAYYRGKF
ncbi:MAG: aldo/keto reductase [Desulfobacterales bacterium]|jgi:aryl-alcohol dehydrogenase-like predicted oxidoreductase|nr:aldo/keto reductase [Desulfobacterales bacterium]